MRIAVVTALAAAVVIAAGALVFVDRSDGDEAAVGSEDTSTPPEPSTIEPTTTTTAAPTTTTAAPTTTTTEAPPPPPKFGRGDEGSEVLAIQVRLVELGYWLPAADGAYGFLTSQAVMAFQKVEGLARDGIAGPQTLAALDTAGSATPRDPNGSHVEIDLERQVMFVVRDGASLAFNTSTGRSGWRTPAGEFTMTREIDGMREAELGDLWRPKYFNGGIAMHGSGSIPGQPASHGCTRLSNAAIDFIWDSGLVPIGTHVSVY
ncbi:MAG TPA: L,D-transpeptidase family protein [Acidimicrobiales bacterium]|nr:L,D-transpeptidase family protein [Acidimicrobiales bacterium]